MAIIIRISLDRILIAVIVAILPLIIHFTTAIRVFPSWNGLNLTVLKSAHFCLVHTQNKNMAFIVCI